MNIDSEHSVIPIDAGSSQLVGSLSGTALKGLPSRQTHASDRAKSHIIGERTIGEDAATPTDHAPPSQSRKRIGDDLSSPRTKPSCKPLYNGLPREWQ